MKSRMLVLLALLCFVVAGTAPAHAAGRIHLADGSVALPGYPAEFVAYTGSGCAADSLDGVFVAFMDVRKYVGKTLIVTVGVADATVSDPIFTPHGALTVGTFGECAPGIGTDYLNTYSANSVVPGKFQVKTGVRYIAIWQTATYPIFVKLHFSVYRCDLAFASCS